MTHLKCWRCTSLLVPPYEKCAECKAPTCRECFRKKDYRSQDGKKRLCSYPCLQVHDAKEQDAKLALSARLL